ncbi:MAG TPA: molybdenum cofactor guanylyltransferase [Rhizomicrobium sp.]
MSAAGIVLAGVAGTRIGGDKALQPFGAATLLDAVIARVEGQVSTLALSVPANSASTYARFGAPLVFDSFPEGTGPLAGIVAGLGWLAARGEARWLASFPCDTPFLPRDLVAQLLTQADQVPVAARDANGLHGVCALWPVACAPTLRAGVEAGTLRSLKSALAALGATACDIAGDAGAFFNVNTQDDLSKAEALARRQ